MSPRARPKPGDFDAISPDGDAEAFDDGVDAESEWHEAPRRAAAGSMFQVGCTWLALGTLALIAALACGVWWTIERVQRGRWAASLPVSFQDVSVLPGAPIKPAEPETTLRLFFVAPDGTLAPVERRLRIPAGGVERTHVVAHELLRPPEDGQLASPLPPGAELRGVFLHNGIALVDLSREFQQSAHPTPQGERLAVYSIVDSILLNNTNLQGVCLLVEGRPVNSAWGWMDLSSPLGPDLSLVKQ